MDKVLIAEDNPVLVKILESGLKKHRDKFETIATKDGEEAIAVLKQEPIGLLITDLQMPKIDGIALLAYMNEHHPEIPCIVMTAHGTPQIKAQLQRDVLRFIEKPFEIVDLVNTILPALEQDAPAGTLNGISIANFLQLIQMEQKTCLFEVDAAENKKGFFYFEDGILFDAVYGDLKGEEAALKIIPLERVKIRFKNLSKGKKRISRRITTDLMALIMEAMRVYDELQAASNPDPEPSVEEALPEFEDFDLFEKELTDAEGAESSDGAAEPQIAPDPREAAPALSSVIRDLKAINGYRAAAVMNFTGEVLIGDAVDAQIDLGYVSAMFNDVFRAAHKACEKSGFETNLETTVVTPKGIVLMRRSAAEEQPPVHVIVLLERDGNQALMKMELKRMMPSIVRQMA